jgi:hypothetical protein
METQTKYCKANDRTVSPLIKKECREETPNLGSVCMCYGEKNSTLHPRLAKMKRNINSNKEHRYCTSINIC